MRNLVPLTKILLTLGTAVWAIVLHRPESLLYLCVLELLILLISGELFKNMKALIMLIIFAALLGAIEKVGGGSTEESVVAALRMLGMTIIFIYLLGTVKLQDLTASMVRQLKVPYEYAFMFTAGLRFIPDFIEENRAVSEAQACRGLAVKGNFFKPGQALHVHRSSADAPLPGKKRNHGPLSGTPRLRRIPENLHGKRGAQGKRLRLHGPHPPCHRCRHLRPGETGDVRQV